MKELEQLYTPEEVARRYRRTAVTINRWVRQGRITAVNTGGGRCGPYVFRREDLDRFEERYLVGAGERGAAQEGPNRERGDS